MLFRSEGTEGTGAAHEGEREGEVDPMVPLALFADGFTEFVEGGGAVCDGGGGSSEEALSSPTPAAFDS